MHYYLYQITNKVNGKIYVGVHQTSNLDDDYMGSGVVIQRAIATHSIENFEKVILEHFEDSKSMYAREAEIVTDAFLARDDVYNLRRGGSGGFDYINSHPELFLTEKRLNALLTFDEANVRRKLKFDSSPEFRELMRENCRKMGLRSIELHGSRFSELNKCPQFQAKRKQKMKETQHQQGDKNSQFGSMWITNEVENKKIKKTDLIPDGWRKGRVLK